MLLPFSMKLAIDIGNTRTKYAFFDENSMVESGKIGELADLGSFMSERAGDFERAIIGSVNYGQEDLAPFLPSDKDLLYFNHRTPIPIGMAYDTPQTLGVDRLAAVIGAHFLFPKRAVVVVDIGTCITYDFLNAAGVFEGGVISPGSALRYKAMHDYTARLPLLNDCEGDGLIGKNTTSAMTIGVTRGIVGEIEYMLSQFLLKSPGLKVIVTGGGAKTFESRIKADIFVTLEIVLVGLNRVLDYNA